MSPKITVYTPSHNYGHYLATAIESVLRQSMDSWELLLIDDGSTDDTAEVISRYAGDARVRAFKTPGIGLHGVGNLAIREARGDYIIRLDGDDIFEENILLVLSNYLDRHPAAALVFPDYFLIDDFGEVFAQERRQPVYASNHMLDMPPHGAGTMFRKKVLEEVGGYQPELGAQDGFYIWNKIAQSHKSANVNAPLFYYRRHGDNLTNRFNHILEARRRIKKDHIATSLPQHGPYCAIIPCRKNYDFCPDVWSRQIRGKTLLHYKIASCIKSSLLDHIVVASDSEEVKEVIASFDDPRVRFFAREPRETIRSETIVTTLEKIIDQFDPLRKGVSVLSYVQNPLVTTDTLEEAICTLILNEADSSFGVQEIRSPLYKRASFGLQPLNPPVGFSTDFDTVYCQTNTFLATRNKNFSSGALMGPRVVNFVVSERENLFINSEHTLQIAAVMMAQRELFEA